MAMIKCPECDSRISDLAEHCPKCGCPRSRWNVLYKKNIFGKTVQVFCPKCKSPNCEWGLERIVIKPEKRKITFTWRGVKEKVVRQLPV